MLIHIDCENLSLKMVGGIMKVNCRIKKKKCLDCFRYKSLIKEYQLIECKGLLKYLVKNNLKKMQ